MKLVIKEEVNLIGEVRTSSYTVLTNPVTEYNNIPMSIGQAKGDLIVFKGPGEPVRFPAGSANGKVPMTDNTSPTGWTLGDGGGGGGASVVLHNGSGAQMLAGTVVYAVEINGKLEAYKADAYTDQRLYILNDDLADGEEGQASFVPGSVASVLCDTYEVVVGDSIRVGETAGMACAADGNATIGIAMSNKDPGVTGLVKVRLIENHTKKVINKSGSSNMIGTVYTLPGGDTDGVPHAVQAVKGKRCFGIQTGAQSVNDGPALLMVQPGDEAVVRADNTEIRIGDWLVPSASNPGKVRNGSGYGIGEALEAKAANAANTLVKIKMYPLQYGYSPRAWWLVGNIAEDQVIGAWQFVQRASEAEALLSINNGIEYTLQKSGDDILWNSETGIFIPAGPSKGLGNTTLTAMEANTFVSAAFGFAGQDISSVNSQGIRLKTNRILTQNGRVYKSSSTDRTGMTLQHGSPDSYYGGTPFNSGVLGGNWTNPAIYCNGEAVAIASSQYGYPSGWHYNCVFGGNTNGGTWSSLYLTALVLYNIELSASDHQELYYNIRSLGGIG